MNFKKIFCVLVSLLLISSCASFKKDKKGEEVETVEQMYNGAVGKLEKGSYEDAIEKFEELERTYPYSKWAIKSQIMAAYSAYKNEDYDNALIILERFTKLHPGNKDIAYAYYLRALSFYEQISDVTKDQSYSLYAKSALQELIARFPDTKYATDAKFKLDLVNDHLAGKELEVGRFYLNKGKPIAAINRFKKVIEHYDTTAHVPEALHRLVETYMSLGVKDEAIKYAAVLGYNFPESKWYERSYYLVEGKKPSKTQLSKWYDFKGWKGVKFIKNKIGFTRSDDKENLVEEFDRSVDEKPIQIDKEVKKSNKTPLPKVRNSGGVISDFTRWVKSMKLPFSGDKPNQDENQEE